MEVQIEILPKRKEGYIEDFRFSDIPSSELNHRASLTLLVLFPAYVGVLLTISLFFLSDLIFIHRIETR